MNKRILLGLASSLLLAASGCAHESRTAAADPTPNIGGENIDQSSARNNTDPAVVDPPDTTSSGQTGTGSGQQ